MSQRPAAVLGKLDLWFITPRNKFLAGDLTYTDKDGNLREEYVNNLVIQDIEIISTERWRIRAGNYIVQINRNRMDGYFVKNHLTMSLDLLNNFKSIPK